MITGGTSGIGFAIAERFLQEGASSIILVGRSRERLEAAATNLRTSGKVQLLVGDVAEAGTWMRELEKQMVSVILKIILSRPYRS
jgi:NADP-dependent 3-hydroxy acid dehydrogenase YdfG